LELYFYLCSLIQGCEKIESSTSTTNTAVKSGYTLQHKELIMLDRLLQDEQTAFIEGRDAILFGHKIPFISAYDVAKQYEENQVDADQKFFDKQLQVNGTIESINSGIGNEPYITMRGSNQFLSPQIHFDEGNIEKIASLKKGRRLAFCA
jgi:tRNA_anti-like